MSTQWFYTHRGRAKVLLLTAKVPAGLEGTAAPDGIIEAGGPRPRVHWRDAQLADLPEGSTAVEAWATVARQVLDALLGRK